MNKDTFHGPHNSISSSIIRVVDFWQARRGAKHNKATSVVGRSECMIAYRKAFSGI
jgi:hypothetical protein